MNKQRFCFKPICALLLSVFLVQTAQANPIGATVVNGQASIAAQGNTLTVTNTPNAIINWQGFSIGANETTRFVQQSTSSAVLNRVITNNPSSILGSLQSNGRVFIVNPNGIVFGQGSTVNVGGLVATTLSLSNADFLAGRNSFTDVPGAQNISNAGNITAQTGGQVYLIAPNVDNSGVINAPNGEILLAAGRSIELVNSLDPNLKVNITAPAGDATNIGQLVASSGSLGLFGTVVRNSGTVSADSATLQGGKIVFKASQRVDAGGTISAQGVGGGTIAVLANMQTGTVNVTGTLDASAPNSGNGGFIDTSAAHVQVANTAKVTTFASNGKNGTWLIDPFDFTIAVTGGDMTGAALSTSLGLGNVIIANTAGAVAGPGNIFVKDIVAWNTATSLTLNAAASIFINSPIQSSLGSLVLKHGVGGSATVQPVPYIGNNGNNSMLFLGGTLNVQSAGVAGTGTLNLFNGFASVGGLSAAILNMDGAEIMSSQGIGFPATLTVSGGVKFTGAPSALDNVILNVTGASSIGVGANPATLFMRNGAAINNNASVWTMSNGSSIIQEGLTATSFNNISTAALTTPVGISHIAGTTVTGAPPTGTWDTAAVITNSGIWDITGGPNNNNVSNLSQYITVSVVNNPGAVMFSYDPTYVNPTIVPANVAFTNNGTMDIGAGSMSLSSSAVNNGIMNINGISWIDILATGNLTNNGTINLGGPVANGAGFVSAPGYGDIRVYGGIFTNAAAGVLNSLPDWGGWNWVHAYNSGTISNNGTVNVSNLSTMDWQNSNSSTNAGTFNVAAGGYLLVADPIARMLTVPPGAAYTFNGPVNVAAGGFLDAFGVLYTGPGAYTLGTLTPATTLATATAPVVTALSTVVSTIVLPPPVIPLSSLAPPPLLQTVPATDPNNQAAQDAAAAAAAAAGTPAPTTVAAAPLPVCQ